MGLASLLHRLSLQVVPPAGSAAAPERVSAVAKFAPTDAEASHEAPFLFLGPSDHPPSQQPFCFFAAASLLALTLPANARAQALAMASRLGSFRRECGFYGALAGAPAAGAAGGVALPAAPAWFARHDPAGGGACLLFEDLDGASPAWASGDQVAGASLAGARATLRSAAALHAAYWRHPQLAAWSAEGGWLPALDSEHVLSFDSAEFAASWPRWRARFPAAADALPPAVAAAFDAQPDGFARAARRLLRGLAREPRTLLHGDLRFDNVFLRREGSADGVTHARFIDMGGALAVQIRVSLSCRWSDEVARPICMRDADCAAGRSMFDVAYFLSMSVDTQLRRAHEAELLGDYCATLQRLLGPARAADAPSNAADAMADYRAATAYVFCLAVNLGGGAGLMEGPARRRSLASAMAARAAAAVADAGADTLLPL